MASLYSSMANATCNCRPICLTLYRHLWHLVTMLHFCHLWPVSPVQHALLAWWHVEAFQHLWWLDILCQDWLNAVLWHVVWATWYQLAQLPVVLPPRHIRCLTWVNCLHSLESVNMVSSYHSFWCCTSVAKSEIFNTSSYVRLGPQNWGTVPHVWFGFRFCCTITVEDIWVILLSFCKACWVMLEHHNW